jgi:type IV pilus assembly protein PilW
MRNKIQNERGVTLVELLVALVMSAIVMLAIMATFASQERSQAIQQQVGQMQQNLRSAMYIMSSEIRMAGYDTSLDRAAGAGIILAWPDQIQFTMDVTGGEADGEDDDADGATDEADEAQYGDGDTNDVNEDIRYALDAADDADANGRADTKVGVLGRETCRTAGCSGLQPMAEGIYAIRFTYGYDDDNDGVPDGWGADYDKDGDLDTDGGDELDLNTIITVRIVAVGTTELPISEIVDADAYDTDGDADLDLDKDGVKDGIIPAVGDKHVRRVLTLDVQCRNLGL